MTSTSAAPTSSPLTRLALAALCLTVFAVPWEEAVVVEGIGSVARLTGFAAAALGVLSLIRGGTLRFRPPSLLLVLSLVYATWLTLSYFWTVDAAASREGLLTMAQLLLLLWLVWQLCADPRARNAVLQAFVLGALVVAVNVLWIFLFAPDTIRIDGRIASAGENQNEVATILAIGMAIAWWLIVERRGRLSGVVNALFLLLAPFALILTGSRSGLLLAVLALAQVPLVFFRVSRGVRAGLLAGVGSVVLLVVTLPPDLYVRALPNLERLSGVGADLTSSDYTGRTEIWKGGLVALTRRPVIGYGNNAFRAAVRPILGSGWAPHNAFLSVAVGTGLIGLALFAAVLASAFASQLLLRPSAAKVARIFLLAVLLLAMLPKGAAYDKSVWLVLGLVTADVGPVLTRAAGYVRARPSEVRG